MQDDEHIGFWSFPIFFRVLNYTGNKLLIHNQAFIKKRLEKPSSKTSFPVGARSKRSFLTSTTAVTTQQMSKVQSRLVVKPKTIKSICLINQIICEMHLILESYMI